MAKYNIDPPPAGSNAGINNWLNNLHETLTFVFQNIDSDNMSDEFVNSIGIKNSESEDS